MTSSRPLAIAVLGAGVIGREHAARLKANPRCRLVAIVDPAPADLGVPLYENVAALLQAERLDGAIVATPNHTHVEVALPLLDAGVPVLVEKPIADTLPAAAQLVRAAERTGVPVLIGHHRRHGPAMHAARACIARGTLGRIVAVTATVLFHKPSAYFDLAWRRGPAGGPILINLIHEIDSLRALVGEITAVQAAGSNQVRGFDVEDTAAVIIEFANGALGSVIISDATVSPRSWEHTSGENPMYPREASQDCLFIAGTAGSLAVPSLRLWRQEGEASWVRPFLTSQIPIETADPLTRQLDHFCDVVERRAQPEVTALDGLQTLAATLAIRKAMRTRARVEPV